MVLSLEQRIFLLLEYHHLEHSCVQTRRSFRRRFDVRRDPSDNAIKALIKKFERTGNVSDDRVGNVGRPRSAVTESNADAIQQVILQQPRTSVRSVASRAALRRMITHRIISHMFTYKIQTCQALSVKPLMQVMISRTLCCSLSIRVISMLETYGSRTRHILTLMALSTSRTGAFGEPKTHMLLYLHP
ncbi:hypothetical protein AVEN_94205-1 [Araneus ventricosus]|uniref:DUF4817 domain-containing protein n=1 Tax=Araneus ventricosus TaxID=182803 RepID=A0A4Y2KEB6_ARAVE|nr:hypothetical protein AVEN_94205-1 [Araneus ventricosus]